MSAGLHVDREEIVAILKKVKGGMTLKEACESAARNYTNIIERIHADEELTEMARKAREEHVHVRVQEMHQIAANKDIDVARARLICDNIKWEAARVAPRHYGDKMELTHSGKVEMTDEQLTNRLSILLGKAGITEAAGGEGEAEGS